MTNSKLIYIEDDQILGNLITQALVDYGFEIDFRTTLNGLQESLASMLPDLLILDIEVNNQSCLDILPAIRSQYPQLPIIIASSHTNGAKIVRSYDAGANHYIKKPYDVTELVFQIQNLLQQSEKQLPAIWKIGTYQVDTAKHLLIYPDERIEKLFPKEFQVLQKLYSNKGQVVTRKQLLEEIWGNDSSEESLNNIISQLRKKFMQDKCISIQTYPCIGYQLDFCRTTQPGETEPDPASPGCQIRPSEMKPYSGVKVQTKDSGMLLISITRIVLLRQRAADVSKVCSDPDMIRQIIFRSKQEIISHTRKRSARAFRRLPILEIADTEFFLNPPTAYFLFHHKLRRHVCKPHFDIHIRIGIGRLIARIHQPGSKAAP